MEAEWYYSQSGNQYGPCSLATLRELIRTGVVALSDPIWSNGMPDWVPAGSVPALSVALPAIPAAPVAMPPRPQFKQANPIAAVFGVLAAIVGYAVGQYAMASLLVPAVAAAVIGAITFKLVSTDRKPFVGAFAIQAGHLAWFLTAAIVLHMFGPVLLDLIVLVVGLTWLLWFPGIVPVVLLCLYQFAALIINGLAFSQAYAGSAMHRALTVHLLLRVLAIGLMIYAVVQQRRAAPTPQGFEPIMR